MPKKTKEINFEKALRFLEEITEKLESGNLSLDEAIKAYEEGALLVKLCQGQLGEAETRIELLLKKGKDKFTTEKFDKQETEDDDNILF